MNSMQACVKEFHEKFGCYLSDRPNTEVPEDLQQMRLKLIREETTELEDAMLDRDLEGIADAIGDLLYVTFGMAVAYGIDMQPIYDEIHRANMTKEGGGKRADGKILKPADWAPPVIVPILVEQGAVL